MPEQEATAMVLPYESMGGPGVVCEPSMGGPWVAREQLRTAGIVCVERAGCGEPGGARHRCSGV